MHTTHNSNRAGVVGGLVLILLGLLFLAGNILRVNVWGTVAPLFIMLFGGIFFVGMVVGGKNAGALAIPGSIFVLLGLTLLSQTVFNRFETMSYAWGLFVIGGVGIGLVIYSWWSDKPNLKRPGYLMIVLGLVFFVTFGLFFETLFGLFGANLTGSFVLPAILIVMGTLLMFRRLIDWNSVLDQLPPRTGKHA